MSAGRLLRRAAACLFLGGLAAGSPFTPAGPAPAGAQDVEREVQVPLDSLRAIVEVSPGLRDALGLFPEVEDFVAARLFVTRTGREILEVSFREDGRLVRERRWVTAADLAALRERIGTRMADGGAATPVEREARGSLVLAETVLGLGFYGWAVPEILDIESTRGQVAAYLLTAGASFLVPYLVTENISVREAHRDAMVWGGTRGIAYGALLGDALTGGDEEDRVDPGFQEDDGEGDHRVVLAAAVLTSLAGQVLGYQAVDATDATRGTVALWSTVGDLSLAYGFGASFVAGLYDADPVCEEFVDLPPGDQVICYGDDTRRTAAGHAGTMAVGLAGLWAAKRMGEREDYTVGDARALLSAGILGGQAVLPLAWAAFHDDDDGDVEGNGGDKPLAASLVAGSVGGLWLANRTLRRHSLTPSDGLLVQAGHLAGGLAAAGLTYLADSGDSADELVYFTTTAVGSLAGAWLTFRAVRDGDGGRSVGASDVGAGSAPGRRPGPSVEVSTLGAAPLLLEGLGRRPADGGRLTRLPILTVRW